MLWHHIVLQVGANNVEQPVTSIFKGMEATGSSKCWYLLTKL